MQPGRLACTSHEKGIQLATSSRSKRAVSVCATWEPLEESRVSERDRASWIKTVWDRRLKMCRHRCSRLASHGEEQWVLGRCSNPVAKASPSTANY